MGFADQLKGFSAKAQQRLTATRDGVDTEVFRSIVDGSELTAAPGQPFDPVSSDKNAGELRDSWTLEKDGDTTVISTPVDYAVAVEYNLRGVHFRNHGAHSRDMTVAGFSRVVEAVTERVKDQS